MQLSTTFLRLLINGLAYVSQELSAKLSYPIWTKTARHPMPEKEKSVYESAIKKTIQVNGCNIMTYSWCIEERCPLILLLHGWNGRGTQLTGMIERLCENGYGVVSFDGKGHGLSDGNHTNLMELVAIVQMLQKEYGGFYAMIGHSFGVMVAVNSIYRGVVCKKIIGISPPTDFNDLLYVFSNYLGLNKKARQALVDYVLKKLNIESFESISITGIAPKLSMSCLLIHDENDERVPLPQAQRAVEVWSGAKLHITQGLGHVRILHKPAVLNLCLEFLKADS